MHNSKTHVLKTLQTMLCLHDETIEIPKSLLQDVYELLTEPYQISIEDILSEEEVDKLHEI